MGSFTSRHPLELLEVGFPFLDEGGFAFFGFFAHVVEQGGVAGEVEETHLTVAVGIQGGFEAAEGQGAVLEHLAAPDEGLGLKIGEGDDFVHEAHVERFLGIVLAAEIPDLPGFLLADDAGEVTAAEATVEAADFGAGLAELGVVRRDGEIAHDMEHMPAADGVAGDHGDDGLRQGADLALDVEDVQARDAVFADVTGVATHFLIAPGAEGEGTFATEDDDTHVGIFMQHLQRDEHLLHGLRAEGIAHFRPVDGELADAVFGFLKLDVFEGFDRGPHGSWRDEKCVRCSTHYVASVQVRWLIKPACRPTWGRLYLLIVFEDGKVLQALRWFVGAGIEPRGSLG